MIPVNLTQHYVEGQRAARAYYRSQAYTSLTRFVRPEDAMRLFLPPITESMTQVAMPMPKDRVEWIQGFRDWQQDYFQQMEETQP